MTLARSLFSRVMLKRRTLGYNNIVIYSDHVVIMLIQCCPLSTHSHQQCLYSHLYCLMLLWTTSCIHRWCSSRTLPRYCPGYSLTVPSRNPSPVTCTWSTVELCSSHSRQSQKQRWFSIGGGLTVD